MAYTNSSLVNHTHLSPNHYNGRNHVIDTITIHCVVGQCSVESLGNLFANSSLQASSNYGIGYDGKVGLYVEEKNAAWTSSNYANDNRAITIEVASDTYDPYRVKDAAYKTLIKLVADICRRNGIKKLVWSTSKYNRVNHVNGCNMTVHRDYANKSCPGDYLYNLHGQIASEVNKLLGTSGGSSGSSSGSATPKNVAKPTVIFRIRQGGTWQKEGFTGTAGKAITDIAIKVSKGSVKYRVHLKGGSWLPWVTGYNVNEPTNGYAGDGKEIDGVQVYYTTPSDVISAYGYYKAKYLVSPLKKGYYSYQYDTETSNGQDGYAGIYGKTIDRFLVLLSQ